MIALSDVFLKKVAHPIHFISAILAAVEEESDPRSLVITFDLLRFLQQGYLNEQVAGSKEAYEGYLEDIFDRITVYFPINF